MLSGGTLRSTRGMPRFALLPEPENENINEKKYLFPRVGIEPTCRVHSHALVRHVTPLSF